MCVCIRHTLRGCVDWNSGGLAEVVVKTVTPCVGVWIETPCFSTFVNKNKSHPAWVCGLKPSNSDMISSANGHTLRGCVDWNIKRCWYMNAGMVTPCVGVWIETEKIGTYLLVNEVTPCVGVWIETWKKTNTIKPLISHTLRGCVDWNSQK